jgi:hypothetical protein
VLLSGDHLEYCQHNCDRELQCPGSCCWDTHLAVVSSGCRELSLFEPVNLEIFFGCLKSLNFLWAMVPKAETLGLARNEW